MEIKIQKANKKDIDIIAKFQVEMAWETESYKLDSNTVVKGVEAVFNHDEYGQYYIAKLNDETIASLLTTYEWSDWRNARVLWIQSVFVKEKYRRQGVFSMFYSHIKKNALNNDNIGGIRLYVDKTNIPAQETYNKVGMNGEHYKLFEWMK
jgi:GNAT superfamily N-acetyltransferase